MSSRLCRCCACSSATFPKARSTGGLNPAWLRCWRATLTSPGVVRFERKRWAQPQNWPELMRSIGWVRAQRFDWVIDLQCLLRSGAFAWLANGELLVGLDEPREGARGFYDIIVPAPLLPNTRGGLVPERAAA